MSAQTVEKLTNQFNEIQALPSGSSFTLTLSDADATAAAGEYLSKYMAKIQQAINDAIGMKVDISNPTITFGEDEVTLQLKAGKNFLKFDASAKATVIWDNNDLTVNVIELHIPLISVSVESANSLIAEPVKAGMNELLKYYDVQSFKISEGVAELTATKK